MPEALRFGQSARSHIEPHSFVRTVHGTSGSDAYGRELGQFDTDRLTVLQQLLALPAVLDMSPIFSRPLLLDEFLNFLDAEVSVIQLSSIAKTILLPEFLRLGLCPVSFLYRQSDGKCSFPPLSPSIPKPGSRQLPWTSCRAGNTARKLPVPSALVARPHAAAVFYRPGG